MVQAFVLVENRDPPHQLLLLHEILVSTLNSRVTLI